MLDAGLDVNKELDDNKWTPLHAAVAAGSVEAVKLLIERRAKADLKDRAGRSLTQISQRLNNQTRLQVMKALQK